MGIQARTGKIALPADDVEKLPALPTSTPTSNTNGMNDDLEDDTGKGRRVRSSLLDVRFRLSPRSSLEALFMVLGIIAVCGVLRYDFPFPSKPAPAPWLEDGLAQCRFFAQGPPNPQADANRELSDRYAKGTGAYHLKNATVWTGNDDGNEILYGADVWLEGGVIRKVGGGAGEFAALRTQAKKHETQVHEHELHGAWLTPGIVDMHSHMGASSLPYLNGASGDENSIKGDIQPWLRSLDGFNTHDLAFNNSIAGGITTILVLPGSADSMGGQAFVFKPRTTVENTPQSMQLEPPFRITPGKNGKTSGLGWERTGAWRHTKHACGENPKNVYGQVRMDNSWNVRTAYEEGRKLKAKQDEWCASPHTQKEAFPTDLKWEILADTIRGNVIVNNHCYETVDLNNMVRISNEFKFRIASFHHAHETYLVPDLLKQMYGGPPTVAIFATNGHYKREAYRGTNYAGAILAEEGINIAYKSDHPVLDSRYLLFEAQQGHHYGLNFSQALGSITTHTSRAIGMDHRVGYVRQGYDADVVVWDSFPLAVGATPKQTFIDGIPQITEPFTQAKPAEAQEITEAGPWKEGAAAALAARGDPDLRPKKHLQDILLSNVNEVYLPSQGFEVTKLDKGDVVVVRAGEIACIGSCEAEITLMKEDAEFEVVDLKGGSLTRGLITVGSPLGLAEIDQEEATHDGEPYDALVSSVDLEEGIVVHAVDGAQFDGKDELMAYRAGVTVGVTAPETTAFIDGLSYAFGTGALHPLEEGAILNTGGAVFFNLEKSRESISTKIAVLRRLLKGDYNETSELVDVVAKIKRGELRAVVAAHSADHISTLIRLKRDWAPGMKLTILGGMESWMVANELAKEDVGVIVNPARSFPNQWVSRRIIPGLPLSQHSLAGYLASRGVLVGVGTAEVWSTANTRLEAAWLYANEPDVFSKTAAIDLVSRNLVELLGLKGVEPEKEGQGEMDLGWVAWEGDMFSFQGRVKAIKAPGKTGRVDLL